MFKFLDVRETAERYLTALKPLVPDFQFAKSEKSVEEFIKSHASKFNSLLNGMNSYDSLIMTKNFLARAATHENWCVEWWLDEMYLRQRLPLPVNNSSGMIVHSNHSRSKSENAAFIAEIIKLVIKYKSHVENNELNEQSTGQLAGSHLCMAQVRIHSHDQADQVISGHYEVNFESVTVQTNF